MTTLTNSFEGGTSGSNITTANSGGKSGNAFDSTFTGTGTTLTYSNTHAAHGLLSAKVTVGSTATTCLAEWSTSEGGQPTIWWRCYCYFAGNPGALAQPCRMIYSGGFGSGVQITSGGQIQTYYTLATAAATFTTPLPVNQWFRLEGYVTGGTSTGVVSASLFVPMDDQSAVESHTTTGLDTGTLSGYWFGNAGSNANSGTYWIDDVGISAAGYLGPVVKEQGGSGAVSAVPALIAAGLI
jgi:hypothetical protein